MLGTAGGHALRAQRHRFRPRQIPGARRRRRGSSGVPRTTRRSGSSSSATRSIAITRFDPLTGHAHEPARALITFYPAKQFVTPGGQNERALASDPRGAGRADRLVRERRASCSRRSGCKMRTEYDLEMMQEMGFCHGIENYSPASDRPRAGLDAVHAARFFPGRFSAGGRRDPRHDPADRRDV